MRTLRKLHIEKEHPFLCLLHLSDLHLSSAVDKNELDALFRSLEGQLTELDHSPDLIIVTGDIVHNSELSPRREKDHVTELRSAKHRLDALCNNVGLDPKDRLLVVPGNHDYRWLGNFPSDNAKSGFLEVFGKCFEHRFYQSNGQNLLVASFDSNVVKFANEFATGHVSLTEFDELSKELVQNDLRNVSAFRLGLVHHHPLPVAKAESPFRLSWLEKLLKGRLVGAQEFLLLKNAGGFIQRLLDNEFRLVIHGHVHQRDYWRVHSQGDEARDRWIEIISGGAIEASKRDHCPQFGVIRIFQDGHVEATQHEFNPDGGARNPPHSVTCAPYEVVRLIDYEGSVKSNARCKVFDQKWQVDLLSGDVACCKVIRGLNPLSGTLTELEVPTAGGKLTLNKISPHSLTEDHIVKSEYDMPKRNEESIRHKLIFTPPLSRERPLDLVCQCAYQGVKFRSVEDQVQFGMNETERGKDGISQKIMWHYDHLHITLRFKKDSTIGVPWTPKGIVLRVYDPNGKECEQEQQGQHLFQDFWSEDRCSRLKVSPPIEYVVSIYRPRRGYTYRIEWDLPARESIDPEELRRIEEDQRKLLDAGNHQCDELAQGVKERFITFLKNLDDDGQSNEIEESLHAYVFAYEPGAARLSAICSTAGRLDKLLLTKISYGRDIIGTAFRRRLPVAFHRDMYVSGCLLTEKLPEELQHVFACPISRNTFDGPRYPIGVFALASSDAHSALQRLDGKEEQIANLHRELLDFWDSQRHI